jgi:PAS domain S-box-containing protein
MATEESHEIWPLICFKLIANTRESRIQTETAMAANHSSGANGLAHWLKRSSQWDGWILVLGGGIVLTGWCLGNESLKRVIPGFVAMNPMTALSFVFAGISLLCYWRGENRSSPAAIAGRTLAGFLVVVGALKLCAYEFGWQLPFDRVLFHDQILQETGFPNQIAPNTAFNFLMGGLALWLLNSPRRRFSRWAQNMSLALMFISLVPLVGYVYQASYLYSIGSYIPMALHTAALFCILAFGILLAQTESGIVAVLTSQTPGGTVARRLLPFAFGVPFVLGALVILGEKARIFPAELAVSIIVVGSFAVFSGLIWWNALTLNRADQTRCRAETQLQKANDQLEARVAERTASLQQANETLHLQILRQKEAEEKIRKQAELLDQARDAILVLDAEQRVIFWNKGAERIYGWQRREIMGKNAGHFLFANGEPAGLQKVTETGAWSGELQQTTKGGQKLTVESSWTLVGEDARHGKHILIINTNITEKKNYEAQLLRSQRMESIGALAGGIAHDLNNALAPVIMGAELLRQNPEMENRELLLDTILTSANRGTEMVRQLLSFARGSQSRNGPVQIDSLLKEMIKILRDTFPKAIAVDSSINGNPGAVRGDATEIHQVLLNLCINARDAMPRGGRLTLAAENVVLAGEDIPSSAGAKPGAYVLLSVADTGTGIPPEVLPRIFDPFFTTKGPDKGTGLGLSTVNNIVKNHNGFIRINTEAGKGTEFRIYLPALPAAEATEARTAKPALPMGHGEMIMVMDDEQAVREITKTTLESCGYRVVTAANGLLGITCFGEYKDDIKVVVSDTDMPYMDGLIAIHAIQKMKPDVHVIIASGGKPESEPLENIDASRVVRLNKPFTVDRLLTMVAEAIASEMQKN